MLTEIKAYSSLQSAPALTLSDDGRAETDLVQIRNIEGLNPVKATVNTIPYGSVDGAAHVGSGVPTRNILLTVGLNPDWHTWTYESLRAILYAYFMPKNSVLLVFYSDNLIPVQIEGIVEDVMVNPFSKDPELIISIICPDPYFTAVEPEIIMGETCLPDEVITETIDYNGNVEAGIYIEVKWITNPGATKVGVQIGDPALTYFDVVAQVNSTKYFRMSSLFTRKFIENITFDEGIITSLLNKVTVKEGSAWPTLQPGENNFCVITDAGMQEWELTYYERFGGL
jgi:hypothetical protein